MPSRAVKGSFPGLGLRLGFFEFLDVFGWVLVKVLSAILAAELDFAAFVGIKHGTAHVSTQLFTRYDARLQGVWNKFAGQFLVIRANDQGKTQNARDQPG